MTVARVGGLARLAAGAASRGVARVGGRALVERRVERRFSIVLRRGPYRASPRAVELHRSLVVADLHADSLLYGRDLLRRSAAGHVDVPRLIEGGVAIQTLAACVRVARHLNVVANDDSSDDVGLLAILLGWPPRAWRSNLERALHLAARARRFADRSGGRFWIVDGPVSLEAFLARRRTDRAITAGLLSIEGAAAIDGDIGNVARLAGAGFRIFGLTHMVDNRYAGSATGVARGGLSDEGRELVRTLEAHDLLVDVAHASDRAVEDVLAIAARPVIASHTGVRGAHDSPRNLPDEHVAGIAATGGVVGIGFWPAVTGGDDAASIARSVVHAVRLGGVEHVGLGSDFDGAVPTPFDATGMPLLTDALLAEGLADEAIAAIMGGNVVRLLRGGGPGPESDGGADAGGGRRPVC